MYSHHIIKSQPSKPLPQIPGLHRLNLARDSQFVPSNNEPQVQSFNSWMIERLAPLREQYDEQRKAEQEQYNIEREQHAAARIANGGTAKLPNHDPPETYEEYKAQQVARGHNKYIENSPATYVPVRPTLTDSSYIFIDTNNHQARRESVPRWKKFTRGKGVKTVAIDKEGTYLIFGTGIGDFVRAKMCFKAIKGREMDGHEFEMLLVKRGECPYWKWPPFSREERARLRKASWEKEDAEAEAGGKPKKKKKKGRLKMKEAKEAAQADAT